MKKYAFKKYHPKYRILFQREKNKLKKIVPKNSIIEHIGSTSVPRLGGKGIIDITIVIQKKYFEQTKKKLLKDYFIMARKNNSKRFSFQKDYTYGGETRRVHLHLTHPKSKVLEEDIAMRNYLRKNPKVAKKYSDLKKKGVNLAKGEGKIYREYKRDFLGKIQEEALEKWK